MALLASSALAGPKIPASEVRALSVVGSSIVVFTPTARYTAELADVVFTGETLELSGSFTRSSDTNPTMLCTTYRCTQGLDHGVTTDCTKLTPEECARRHKESLDALMKVFPKAKN